MIVPVRTPLGLLATVKLTVPLPTPLLPPVIVIQLALLVATQPHPPVAVTLIVPLPPFVVLIVWFLGEIE